MYDHHQQACEALTALYSPDPEVLAIFLAGSVAKGQERPDSDIDALIVLTDEAFERRLRENSITQVVFGHCNYEGGYFDVKFLNRAGLQAVADRGSEPARNAWLKAKCLFTRDESLLPLAEAAARFPEEEREKKMLSFYAAFSLSTGYLWRTGTPEEAYYRAKTAADVVYFGLRMVLQEHGVLFPSHRRLVETLQREVPESAPLCALAQTLLNEMTDEANAAFAAAVREALSWQPPADYNVVLSQYTRDLELWWRDGAPLIYEW